MKNPPTDSEIIAVVREYGNRAMTYVVRNRLAQNRRRDQPIETSWVLRQLKRLEREGKVRRVESSYAVQICWSAL